MLSRILPAKVACAEQFGAPTGTLKPEELALLGGRITENRRNEFAAGRTCARKALAFFGMHDRAILIGQERQPLWPEGLVGSITHCEGYCAAAAASVADLESIGIDAEPNRPLPPGVLETIAIENERRWLHDAQRSFVCWDRLLFSIKESVFKTWYPITNCWLDFNMAEVTIDPATGTFKASISHNLARISGSLGTIEGRYLVRDSHLFTFACVPSKVERIPCDSDRLISS
jgi:4'-phosphopantetheinyl transferase EntD